MTSGKIILETPRLYLREFVPEDAGALALVISDAETMRHSRLRMTARAWRNGLRATGVVTLRMVTGCGRCC